MTRPAIASSTPRTRRVPRLPRLARVAARLLALLHVLVMAACATTADRAEPIRGRLHYGLADAPEGERLLWPAAPEVARFLYTGTLVGEPNFRPPENSRGTLAKLGRLIAGLDDAPPSPTVLQRPSAVIGDDAGRLYVSDASRQAVFVFDEPAGEMHVWDRATPNARFASPAGVALAPGRVFVADADLAAVFVLDAQGEPLATWGRGVLERPTGVARDAARGLLFVADAAAHDIKVFADDGRLVRTLGRRGEAPGEFNLPSHLAFAAGELYVTDTLNSRVQVFGPDGDAPRRMLGARGLWLGNLVRPKGVSVDSEGNVYVVESYYDSLLVFSRQGEFLMPIGGTGRATGRFYLPSGVWVDGRDRVHVADMFNGRIVLFQFLGGS